jgi:hypothetical protein
MTMAKCTGPDCPLCNEVKNMPSLPEIPVPASANPKFATGGVIKAKPKTPKAEFSPSEVEQLAKRLQECAKSYGVPGMSAFAAQAIAEKFLADQKSALMAKVAGHMTKAADSMITLKEATESANEAMAQTANNWSYPPGGVIFPKTLGDNSGFGLPAVIKTRVHVVQVWHDYTYGESLEDLRSSALVKLTHKASVFGRVVASDLWVTEHDVKQSRVRVAAYVMLPVLAMGDNPESLTSAKKIKAVFFQKIQELNNKLNPKHDEEEAENSDNDKHPF